MTLPHQSSNSEIHLPLHLLPVLGLKPCTTAILSCSFIVFVSTMFKVATEKFKSAYVDHHILYFGSTAPTAGSKLIGRLIK